MGAVGCSGSDGLSDVSGSFGAVVVSAGAVVSDSAGSVGSSGSVGLSGSSSVFLRSVISIFIKLPSIGTVNLMDSAISYPSGADISVRIYVSPAVSVPSTKCGVFPDIQESMIVPSTVFNSRDAPGNSSPVAISNLLNCALVFLFGIESSYNWITASFSLSNTIENVSSEHPYPGGDWIS